MRAEATRQIARCLSKPLRSGCRLMKRVPLLLLLLLCAQVALGWSLEWTQPASGPVPAYNVYRNTNNGPFLLFATTFTTNMPLGNILSGYYGFNVTALSGGQESPPSTNFNLLVLPCQATNPPPPPPPPPPALPGTALVELEAGVRVAPMGLFQDALASGGFFLQSPTVNSGTVTVSTNLAAGTYTVWMRLKATDSAHDSFFMTVDGGAEDASGNETSLSLNWQWRRVNSANGSGPVRTFALTEGAHSFKFRAREANVPLDRICVTKDTAFVPPP